MGMKYRDWLIQQRGTQGEPGFISQAELADRAGYHVTFISKLETSNALPRHPTRQRIHKALGTSERDLHEAGVLSPQRSRVGNAVNEAPASYEAAEGTEDLLAKAHDLVDQVNPDYLGRVVAALELMSRAP
jgi:transcriptional regulator with XRE-family HTH domain